MKVFGIDMKGKGKDDGSRRGKEVYQITPLGKKKMEDGEMNSARMQILGYLSENGPSEASEIAEELHQPTDKVKFMLKRLSPSYVSQVGGPGMRHDFSMGE